MSGPLAAAGAQSNPTRYGALNMGAEQFTGLWTQRSPYRDAATAYLIKKFYQGSRFDSMWDGLNREIGVRLTDVRRPGSSVWNPATVPAALSFYSFKSVNNSGVEVIRVIEDTANSILDVTPGAGTPTILTKASGAGPARFLGRGKTLYIGDAKEQKKWMWPGGWQASINVQPGTLINVGTEPGTMQMALGGITLPIVATISYGTQVAVFINPQAVPAQFANLQGANVTFSGLTGAAYLNGHTYPVQIASTTLGIFTINVAHAAYALLVDSGTGSTGDGTTGGSSPSFSGVQFTVVSDGGQQWKSYGSAVSPWGIPAPTLAPIVMPAAGAGSSITRFWQAQTPLPTDYAILDSNQNVQVITDFVPLSVNITGRVYPNWVPATATNPNPLTTDGGTIWTNAGKIGNWVAGATVVKWAIILDSNQNLQMCTVGGASGGTAPTWATSIPTATTDGGVTWICLGPGVALSTASVSYAYGYHSIDGSVSTTSPSFTIPGGILGPPNLSSNIAYLAVFGQISTLFPGLDQFYIYRTAQGQSTLILEDQIPGDLTGIPYFNYVEQGIPDTSASGGGALNAFIAAPVAHQNDPPPVGFTGPVWYLGRVWGFVGNVVYCSGGPDTLVGNGNTAFPPLNEMPFLGAVIKLRPITVENGGIIVYTTSGIWIVFGTGTSSNPFYDTSYCEKVNLANYNAEDVNGSLICLMEANGKVSSLKIQYPFNPQSGYSEVGLPIGDQFLSVTTGGVNAALYSPATAFLSWCVANTKDVGMYVADGSVGWFRMSAVSPPESGLIWSPRAAIAGGTSAVQSVETAPGVYTLLIGPATSGPILQRDQTGTVWADNGTAYDAYDTKGVNLLCTTGQVTEVAHISAKSAAVGARPTVSVLLGEIAASQSRPFTPLDVTGPDPATTPRSESVFSDRYDLAQNGVNCLSDCILVKFDYGSQAVADELYDWGIFASTEEERKEEAAKS